METNFPPVFVINLEDRKDRWNEIQQSFKEWPVMLERIDAVRASPGWKGCIKSHKKAVEHAKNNSYPWVLVLEDDCIPANGKASFTQFTQLLPYLWQTRDSWELFSGGPTILFDYNVTSTQPLLFNVKSYGAHFMLINEKAYSKIINSPENEPIDVFYKKSMNCLCTLPHIAYQKEGKSDIENTEVNYTNHFTKSSSELTKKLNKHLNGYRVEFFLGPAIVLSLLLLKVTAK